MVSNRPAGMDGVRHVVAVASGKGGVGKSTVAVNLALALAVEGQSVGLLDADIYGPSQAMMLGVSDGTRPGQKDGKWLVPVVAHGLQTMSMAYLTTESTPMVWRGPMASGALQQMLTQTLWRELDVLIVDMPPGTGDIQLTLAQKASVSGAVIVTTPQDIALLDARKGIEMFRKVEIPVLGIVENMAVHTCSNCGHQEHVFGSGGGHRIAADYRTAVLGSLPLDMAIREQTDAGHPPLLSDPDGSVSGSFRAIARAVIDQLAAMDDGGATAPSITVSND